MQKRKKGEEGKNEKGGGRRETFQLLLFYLKKPYGFQKFNKSLWVCEKPFEINKSFARCV